jgi:hypothetical protein
MLTGGDLLNMMDRLLGDTRRELGDVDVRLERANAQLEQLKQRELGVLAVLARVRVREIESGELVEQLDATGREVQQILAKRTEAQTALAGEIDTAEQGLKGLGEERQAQQAVVVGADQAVDSAEAEAQKALAADAAYRARLDAATASDGVADQAEEKAQAAHKDRTEKGKPYEADKLFMYLWNRGYGTTRYTRGPFARLMDGWVARTAGYEPLRRDYWTLSELPARFDEHATRMRARADEDVAAVRALEATAAETAGVPARAATLAAEAEALAKVDERVAAKEAEIAGLVEKRGAFAAGDDDLSRRCTQLLSDTYRGEKMRTLRERATLTPNPEDDAAVDELAAVRADLPRLTDEVARYRTLSSTNRERVTKLEDLSKRFKESRLDTPASEFVNSALIATLLTQLLAGSVGVPDVWDAITKQHRRRQLADPGFGSGRVPRGGNPWGGGFGGGGWPKGGGFGKGGFGGGGFGKGGGFGGGGFRSGGGFRGGGFKSGGGF